MSGNSINAVAEVLAQFDLAGVPGEDAASILAEASRDESGVPDPAQLKAALKTVAIVFLKNGAQPHNLEDALCLAQEYRRGLDFSKLWTEYEKQMRTRHEAGEEPLTAEILAFLGIPNGTLGTTNETTVSLYEYLTAPKGIFDVEYGVYQTCVGCPYLARNLMFMKNDGSLDAYGYESQSEENLNGEAAMKSFLELARQRYILGDNGETWEVGEVLRGPAVEQCEVLLTG
jgi:hypothetical protein